MPTAFTHQLIAEDAITPSRAATMRLADYYFGAQGPDPLFFYRFMSVRSDNNLGRTLHAERVSGVFESMLSYTREHPNALSYVLGYITHYAADSVFHPFVYYYAYAQCATRVARGSLHTQMESDLDSYFLQKEGVEVGQYRLPYTIDDLDLAEITGLYMSVFADRGTPVIAKSIYKAVRGWFRYLKFTIDPHYRKGRFWRGVSRAIGRLIKSSRRLGAMFRRTDFDTYYFNQERKQWSYHDAPDITSDADADTLYAEAIKTSQELINDFMDSYYSRSPLPKEKFNNHLLTGLPLSGQASAT